MFKIRKIITISDYVTAINIILGLCAIIFHDFRFIYASIVFDALDGFVARKTNTVSDFGAELDSICDVVSFGVAPAYLLYYYFNSPYALVASLIFLVCGAFRLARFGVLDVKYFIGLPIPAGALILAIICEFFINYNNYIVNYGISENIINIVVSILGVIFGVLMISDISYPKYPNKIMMGIFGVSLILSMFGIFEPLGICAVCYVIYGLFKNENVQ
ncbi:CDP-diacylglycerol--serine O-phosphatidyltransferase [Methanococcus aeolicus]|uniref:CDP-diacylglycerol--serine O-phosphatidyltransferase n=1 Tax=Methanococcus aeolicus TaxID=42879 RepID=UPI0021C96433|nr:CDP-diacylglycerol--serine O-phosphatidyltransferase [Methanococcus aeolicus]UXM84639.1 CDP-diacylglycerol--serine O-phosphatidyltransferase [Methanococcus aeolicus]